LARCGFTFFKSEKEDARRVSCVDAVRATAIKPAPPLADLIMNTPHERLTRTDDHIEHFVELRDENGVRAI